MYQEQRVRPDTFDRQTFTGPLPPNFLDLEPAPYGKISFGPYGQTIYAASIEIDFDETIVTPTDLNVYIPEPVIGGSLGANQRMAYWRQDGDKLYLNIIAPSGIPVQLLKAYIMHRSGVSDPGFTINNATFYDQNGVDITLLAGITTNLIYNP